MKCLSNFFDLHQHLKSPAYCLLDLDRMESAWLIPYELLQDWTIGWVIDGLCLIPLVNQYNSKILISSGKYFLLLKHFRCSLLPRGTCNCPCFEQTRRWWKICLASCLCCFGLNAGVFWWSRWTSLLFFCRMFFRWGWGIGLSAVRCGLKSISSLENPYLWEVDLNSKSKILLNLYKTCLSRKVVQLHFQWICSFCDYLLSSGHGLLLFWEK